MTPAGIKTETPTTTPTYLWTNRVGISHSKGRIIHHLRMMDHHSDHLSVFIHFHEGFTMGWFHSSHEPPRPIAQPTATGEVVNYIKFCEAIDRVQPKPWLLLIVDDVDVGSSRRDVLCCFFWKLCNTMTTTGLFVSDGESEVLGKKHNSSTNLQRSGTNMNQNLRSWGHWNPYSRLTYFLSASSSDIPGWKFAPRSPLVRETGSTFQKSMLGYCNHHDTQLVNMPWWRFDRKLCQESLLWIRFLQKKAGTTQLKASKFDTSLRHISIEHISTECVMLLMQCPQKEKQRCLGVSSWFRAVSMLYSVSFQLHEGSCKTVKPYKMRFKGFEQEGQRCLWLAKAKVNSSLPSHLISMCVLDRKSVV